MEEAALLRRSFLKSVIAIPAATLLPAESSPDGFDFVYYTDCHIQPELSAVTGCRRCFAQINNAKLDFCIAGGDQVFDVCEQDMSRAHMLFKLYLENEKNLNSKVYRTIGNHDVVGINQRSPVEPGDYAYGKRLYEDYFGKRYYSFDHKGWHFVVLDSIGIEYYKIFKAQFDEEQLAWLKTDLAGVAPKTPVIAVTHVPIATALGSLSQRPSRGVGPIAENSFEVHKLLATCNLKLILQGHLHVWEKSEFRGVQYLISGAVSGAWWEGPMNGTPEGYTLCQVRKDQVNVSYVPYPWTAATVRKST